MPRTASTRAPTGYSIRIVAERTGLGIETLRQWERRYGFPRPARTAGGARVYDEETLETLKLLARACEQGFRPGELVGRPRAEIERAIGGGPAPASRERAPDARVDELVEALVDDDTARIASLLRDAALLLGPRRFVTDLAASLVHRVGELWESKQLDVRHEHVMSDALTTQLRVLRATLEDAGRGPTILLATLPGELHGLGIEMVAVYLAARGADVRVVGVDTPVDQIAEAARALDARVTGISISESSDAREAARGVLALAGALRSGVELWLGGAGAARAAADHGSVRVVTRWEEVDRRLEELD